MMAGSTQILKLVTGSFMPKQSDLYHIHLFRKGCIIYFLSS